MRDSQWQDIVATAFLRMTCQEQSDKMTRSCSFSSNRFRMLVALNPTIILAKAQRFSAAIRFEHTLFALPFAYIGMLLAAGGLPTLGQFIWITVAMVGARTLAMTANRLVHQEEDGKNPRTVTRHLPQGLLKRRDMILAMLLSVGIFVLAASQLNGLALVLSPLVVGVLVLYTYAKYFTWTSHFILGWADAIAPAGAWVGVTGTLEPESVLLALAVAMWIGGFDVIYACLDYDFDRSFGIYSIPRRFGIARSLMLVRGMHLVTSGALLILGIWMGLGVPYYIGWAAVSALLVYQNKLVKPDDLSKVHLAALKINSYVGLILLLATFIAVLL